MNLLKPINLINHRAWLYFFLVFVVSLVTSKAGMNILGPILALCSISTFVIYWKEIPSIAKIIFISCVSLYSIGLTGAYLTDASSDLSRFSQKNIFLLFLPFISLILSKKANREISSYLFIAACTISSIASIYNLVVVNDFNTSIRVHGFLEFSRHINALMLGVAFITLLLNQGLGNRLQKNILLLSLVLSVISLMLSGTRGGWLAFALMFTFISIIYLRRYIPHLILTVFIIAVGLNQLFPIQSEAIYQRILSISNTTTNTSNTARIKMWRGGIEYLTFQKEHDTTKFLFGSGMVSSDANYHGFINSLSKEDASPFVNGDEINGGSDFHNAAIDLTIKSGVIYSALLFFGVMTIFSLSFKNNIRENDPVISSVNAYFIALFTLMPFYSLLQDYSALTITFSFSLILGKIIEVSQNES
ncbi:O-antigen ligase family protein [Vibrio sp. 404]|uniref:O-antigen ligase family protein n=1 Tax=Vibrio marinisediminis TaxID=2758441 RepID=A0A7W2ITR7_9VIBR|nr:O-antigen ligase family protein [Vibrio marinisediminis]MBA5762816.1 O-antigen ligase family protein [Vibrio marinisediminis]